MQQATFSLVRPASDVGQTRAILQSHPVAVGSIGDIDWFVSDGKVNAQYLAQGAEGARNIKMTLVLGF
eukprot:11211102-Lingulodinium_polyedra.AAC.1